MSLELPPRPEPTLEEQPTGEIPITPANWETTQKLHILQDN